MRTPRRAMLLPPGSHLGDAILNTGSHWFLSLCQRTAQV